MRFALGTSLGRAASQGRQAWLRCRDVDRGGALHVGAAVGRAAAGSARARLLQRELARWRVDGPPRGVCQGERPQSGIVDDAGGRQEAPRTGRDACRHRLGAHIGAFSEWAKDNGAASILAVEPEPSNAALFRENHPGVELVEAAITDDEDVTLVVAPNTWRHAVEDVTHYNEGERIAVASIGLDELLETGVDWVKLDIEGAEMKLLSAPRDWKNVERLVVEWSFTKDRALAPFLEALGHLRSVGFACAYGGRGTWDQGEVWPGRTDALVFCARDL